MIIIEKMGDVKRYLDDAKISGPLAAHLKRKITTLRDALDPEATLEEFQLVPQHGLITILTKFDRDLTSAGLPKNLALTKNSTLHNMLSPYNLR